MTIDERLEFLVKSAESLHASCQELHALAAAHGRQIEAHTAQLAQDAKSIRALARIAEAHEHRLNNLEGGEQQ